jgi:hypothetical protein
MFIRKILVKPKSRNQVSSDHIKVTINFDSVKKFLSTRLLLLFNSMTDVIKLIDFGKIKIQIFAGV